MVSLVCRYWIWREVMKLQERRSILNRWTLLDQRTVDAPSTNAFKSRLQQTTGWTFSWTRPGSEAAQGISQGKSPTTDPNLPVTIGRKWHSHSAFYHQRISKQCMLVTRLFCLMWLFWHSIFGLQIYRVCVRIKTQNMQNYAHGAGKSSNRSI